MNFDHLINGANNVLESSRFFVDSGTETGKTWALSIAPDGGYFAEPIEWNPEAAKAVLLSVLDVLQNNRQYTKLNEVMSVFGQRIVTPENPWKVNETKKLVRLAAVVKETYLQKLWRVQFVEKSVVNNLFNRIVALSKENVKRQYELNEAKLPAERAKALGHAIYDSSDSSMFIEFFKLSIQDLIESNSLTYLVNDETVVYRNSKNEGHLSIDLESTVNNIKQMRNPPTIFHGVPSVDQVKCSEKGAHFKFLEKLAVHPDGIDHSILRYVFDHYYYCLRTMERTDFWFRYGVRKGIETSSLINLSLFNGLPETARLLVRSGVDVNQADPRTRITALIETIRKWSVFARGDVQLLIDAGADLDAKDARGETALSLAVQPGAWAIVELLIENGANLTSLPKLLTMCPFGPTLRVINLINSYPKKEKLS